MARMKESLTQESSASNDVFEIKTILLFCIRYARVNLMTCPEGAEGVAATLRKEGFTVKVCQAFFSREKGGEGGGGDVAHSFSTSFSFERVN